MNEYWLLSDVLLHVLIILIIDDFPLSFYQCDEFDDYVIKTFSTKMRKYFSFGKISHI